VTAENDDEMNFVVVKTWFCRFHRNVDFLRLSYLSVSGRNSLPAEKVSFVELIFDRSALQRCNLEQELDDD
jgi:hypothetical protein